MRRSLGLLLLYANLIAGKPQHGLNRPQKQSQPGNISNNCQSEIIYKEVVENVCENIMKEQCDTIQVRKCMPGQNQSCKMVNKQKCETVAKKVCNDSWKEIRQPYTVQECSDNKQPKEPCRKIWVTTGQNQRDWMEDPNCTGKNVSAFTPKLFNLTTRLYIST